MPTRIVFREEANNHGLPRSTPISPSVRGNPSFFPSSTFLGSALQLGSTSEVQPPHSQHSPDNHEDNDDAALETSESESNHAVATAASGPVTPSRTPPRTVVRFRSSILRELNVRSSGSEHERPVHHQGPEGEPLRLSKDDIRASPRLLGYLYSMISGAVMLVSLVQFYREENGLELSDEEGEEDIDTHRYFVTSTALIYRWKFWGAFYVAAVGVGLCLLTLLMHFDTVIAPKLWCVIFRDGSLAERNWIFFLILCYAGGIHICTSTLSVGEIQANVYFTAWIAFVSMVVNYEVWRESAGWPSLSDTVNQHHRETTYNWIWTGLFSAVFSYSVSDIFYSRDDIQLRFRGEEVYIDRNVWLRVLAGVWTEVGVCVLAIVLNELFRTSWQLPCRVHRQHANYRFNFGWRQVEGLIIFGAIAVKFYIILEFTSVSSGIVNGLSNAYFGIWGSFFNSAFCFGTWLKENKNMEYVTRVPH